MIENVRNQRKAFSIFNPEDWGPQTHDFTDFNVRTAPLLILKRAFAESHFAGELGDGDMNQEMDRLV